MKNHKPLTLTITFLFILVASLLTISAVTIKSVSNFPSEVAPGEVIDISIEIENDFEDDVFNVNVNLDLSEDDVPFAPYQSSSERFVDELEESDEKIFRFKLIVLPATESGIYKIPVKISYEDNDEMFLKDELISVIVNSEPELQISLEDSDVLIKGQEGSFSVKIVNSGLADVKFVYLDTKSSSSSIKFLTENEQYIGDIDSDDFDSVKYDVFISESTSNTISLPVVLQFKDATNKEFTKTKNIRLRVYSLEEAQNMGLVAKPNYRTYVILVVLISGFWFYRRRKKKKKINGGS